MTPEQKLQADKRAFMLQYEGKFVYLNKFWPSKYEPRILGLLEIESTSTYLSLRSYSKLADQEYTELFNIFWGYPLGERSSARTIREGKLIANSFIDGRAINLTTEGHVSASLILQLADYLRSISVILPFREYSVEQILSLGWAQYQ